MSRQIAIGIGCKSNASCEAILRAVALAMAQVGDPGGRSRGLYSHERKAAQPALRAAAEALRLELVGFSERELAAAEPRLVSRSPRVAALAGVGSVAEAAALVGAGEGSRILVSKLSADGVSCAIAEAPGS